MGPAELAQGQLDAYNARDLETFLTFYAEDVVVHGLPGTVLMTGREQMRSRYRELFDSSPELNCQLVSRMVKGEWAVDEEKVTGHAADPAGEVHAVAIYRCEDSLIREVYFLK